MSHGGMRSAARAVCARDARSGNLYYISCKNCDLLCIVVIIDIVWIDGAMAPYFPIGERDACE